MESTLSCFKILPFQVSNKVNNICILRCEAEGIGNGDMGDMLIPHRLIKAVLKRIFSYQSLELKRTALLMRLKVQILALMVSLTNILR
jgi:hypothetical protein